MRVYSDDLEARFRDSKNFLDANIPLKSIKTSDNVIQLEVKYLAPKSLTQSNQIVGQEEVCR